MRTAAETARLDAAAGEIRIVVLGHWLYFWTADEVVELLERSSDAGWLLLDLRHVAGIDLPAARSPSSPRWTRRGCSTSADARQPPPAPRH